MNIVQLDLDVPQGIYIIIYLNISHWVNTIYWINYRNACNPFNDPTCDFLIDDAGFFNFISSRPRYGQVNFCDAGANANQLGGFRRDLEYDSSIHPSMHCNIGDQGTTLCNTNSPLGTIYLDLYILIHISVHFETNICIYIDPLFMLIHGFIDFMLSSWQRYVLIYNMLTTIFIDITI